MEHPPDHRQRLHNPVRDYHCEPSPHTSVFAVFNTSIDDPRTVLLRRLHVEGNRRPLLLLLRQLSNIMSIARATASACSDIESLRLRPTTTHIRKAGVKVCVCIYMCVCEGVVKG